MIFAPNKTAITPTMADGHYYDGHNKDIDVEEEANNNPKIYQVSLPYSHINVTYHSRFPVRN